MTRQSIEQCVRTSLLQYFADLGDAEPEGLHDLIMAAAEKPLLAAVLQHAEGNQSKAAQWLGINRNTLRRKLLDHELT